MHVHVQLKHVYVYAHTNTMTAAMRQECASWMPPWLCCLLSAVSIVGDDKLKMATMQGLPLIHLWITLCQHSTTCCCYHSQYSYYIYLHSLRTCMSSNACNHCRVLNSTYYKSKSLYSTCRAYVKSRNAILSLHSSTHPHLFHSLCQPHSSSYTSHALRHYPHILRTVCQVQYSPAH